MVSKDLPLRLHEQTPLHRNEASGVLSGPTRVRQFSQDDAHCFVAESQIADEVEQLLRLVQRVYGDFGLQYSVKLSTRPEKFLGAVETWDHAEASLRAARQAAPEFARALLVEELADDWPSRAEAVGAAGMNVGGKKLTAGRAAEVKRAGLALSVWTVNDPADAQRFVAMGADCIITDVPDKILAALR